jgi:hypothetical protein
MRLATPAVVLLIVAATALVVFADWRVRLGALLAQYIAAAILVSQLVLLDVAAAKMLAGLVATGILAVTALQFSGSIRAPLAEPRDEPQTGPNGDGASPAERRFALPTGFPFRVMAALMVSAMAGYLASQPSLVLPGLQTAPAVNTASYLLIALGLLNLGLTEEPLRAGMGLLTVMTGFELFYAAVEPALAVVALLAASQLAVALAVSYLAAVTYSGDPEAAV